MNEISAIPLDTDQIQNVTQILSGCGMQPHLYQNVAAWEDVTCVARNNKAKQPQPGEEAAADAALENCLLLIGSLSDMAEQKIPVRIGEVHPGLPVIAVDVSPSLGDVVKVMRQGVTDVVDLSHEPNGFCDVVQQALFRGRQTEKERRRVRDLRKRMAMLTPAEREVLDAMMDGMANKETAKKLGIGLRTVELRRAKIMAKMGARSVAELIKLFCEARCPGIDTHALS